MIWPFRKARIDARIEKRAAASGFTAEIIAARESYVSGRRGIGELTATAQAAVSMWEGGLSLADVTGTDLLDRRTLALAARLMAMIAAHASTDFGLVGWMANPFRKSLCSDLTEALLETVTPVDVR